MSTSVTDNANEFSTRSKGDVACLLVLMLVADHQFDALLRDEFLSLALYTAFYLWFVSCFNVVSMFTCAKLFDIIDLNLIDYSYSFMLIFV